MKTKNIIKILKKANEWRRGANIYMPDTKEFGIAIDAAINRLKQYEQMIESMKQTKESIIKKLNEYESLNKTAIGELQFSNIQKEHYLNLLDEVEILLNKDISNNLINKVIQNGKLRGQIDVSIHYNLNNK